VFNSLTGYATGGTYRKFLVAPYTMRRGLEERIDREIAHARRGEEAHLIFKMNALIDKPFIRKLYCASQAGVKVDLIVRGMCCLRPVCRPSAPTSPSVASSAGSSSTAASIGSATAATRRFCWAAPISCPATQPPRRDPLSRPGSRDPARLRDEILETCLRDNMNARVLHGDGVWGTSGPARASNL
jgi:polyphosphate kinase